MNIFTADSLPPVIYMWFWYIHMNVSNANAAINQCLFDIAPNHPANKKTTFSLSGKKNRAGNWLSTTAHRNTYDLSYVIAVSIYDEKLSNPNPEIKKLQPRKIGVNPILNNKKRRFFFFFLFVCLWFIIFQCLWHIVAIYRRVSIPACSLPRTTCIYLYLYTTHIILWLHMKSNEPCNDVRQSKCYHKKYI